MKCIVFAMKALETAEKSVEQMNSGEFQEFLLWLRNRVSVHLGQGLHSGQPSAQAWARHEERIQAGEVEPFKYVDVEALPEVARRRAEEIIAEWQARHGR